MRGEKRELVEHALVNAREALARRLAESSSQAAIFARLAELFDLDEAPERIEVYDNSHISGTNPVGAMIVAGPEGFIKAQYRKFNMKSEDLAPGDDYAMMREMLTRRFSKLAKDKAEVEWLGRARSRADRRRSGPAFRRLCGAGRAWPFRDQGRGGGQGTGPQRRPRAHSSQGTRAACCWSRATRCSIAFRGSATRRTDSPSARIARGARRRITASPLDEVPGIGPCAQARAAPAFRLGQGGEPGRHRRSGKRWRHQRANGQDHL